MGPPNYYSEIYNKIGLSFQPQTFIVLQEQMQQSLGCVLYSITTHTNYRLANSLVGPGAVVDNFCLLDGPGEVPSSENKSIKQLCI